MENLDCMPAEELMQFWNKHQAGRKYSELFPQGGKGTKRAAQDVANYASNKATAINCRLRGEVAPALMYEKICDTIYEGLPEFARW